MSQKVAPNMSLSPTTPPRSCNVWSNYRKGTTNSSGYFTPSKPFSFELQDALDRNSQTQSIAMLFLVAGLIAIITALSFNLWLQNPTITNENALLELGQGGFLLFAAIIQGLRAWQTGNDHSLNRDIHAGLGLFFFALFLREVDIGKLGASHWWHIVENSLRTLAAIAILSFGFYLIRRVKWLLHNIRSLLLSPMMIVTLLGCITYACGWPFDKELMKIDKAFSVWIEETLEVNACLLFLTAAFASGMKVREVKVQIPSSL